MMRTVVISVSVLLLAATLSWLRRSPPIYFQAPDSGAADVARCTALDSEAFAWNAKSGCVVLFDAVLDRSDLISRQELCPVTTKVLPEESLRALNVTQAIVNTVSPLTVEAIMDYNFRVAALSARTQRATEVDCTTSCALKYGLPGAAIGYLTCVMATFGPELVPIVASCFLQPEICPELVPALYPVFLEDLEACGFSGTVPLGAFVGFASCYIAECLLTTPFYCDPAAARTIFTLSGSSQVLRRNSVPWVSSAGSRH